KRSSAESSPTSTTTSRLQATAKQVSIYSGPSTHLPLFSISSSHVSLAVSSVRHSKRSPTKRPSSSSVLSVKLWIRFCCLNSEQMTTLPSRSALESLPLACRLPSADNASPPCPIPIVSAIARLISAA